MFQYCECYAVSIFHLYHFPSISAKLVTPCGTGHKLTPSRNLGYHLPDTNHIIMTRGNVKAKYSFHWFCMYSFASDFSKNRMGKIWQLGQFITLGAIREPMIGKWQLGHGLEFCRDAKWRKWKIHAWLRHPKDSKRLERLGPGLHSVENLVSAIILA